MYKTFVSAMISNEKLCDEALAKRLTDAKTDVLMLAVPLVLCEPNAMREKKARAQECMKFFGKHGIKVGLWIFPTFGYGSGAAVIQGKEAGKFVKKRVFDFMSGDGTREEAFCPSDERFTAAFCECLCEYAKQRPERILLEDDLYLGNCNLCEAGCCCELHLNELYLRSGGRFTPKELSETIVGNDDIYYGESLEEACDFENCLQTDVIDGVRGENVTPICKAFRYVCA